MGDAADGIVEIPLEDLKAALRTVRSTSDNYVLGSDEFAALTEACRLIRVEIVTQHGEDAFKEIAD